MSLINRFLAPTRASVFGPSTSLFHDPFFNDPFFNRNMLQVGHSSQASAPSMDLQETENSFLVNLNVPGFKKEDIEILAEGNTVSIKGTLNSSTENNEKEGNAKTLDHDAKNSNYIYRERFSGSFFRSFTLENFDADNVAAQLQDGVLQLTLPKVKVLEKSKKIEIA